MEIGKLYRFISAQFPSVFEEHKYFFYCIDGSTQDLEINSLVMLLEINHNMVKILTSDGVVGYVYIDCLKGIEDDGSRNVGSFDCRE